MAATRKRKSPQMSNEDLVFERARWPDGPSCPQCDSTLIGDSGIDRAPKRCQECGCKFSVKSGTFLHGCKSDLSLIHAAIRLYANQDYPGMAKLLGNTTSKTMQWRFSDACMASGLLGRGKSPPTSAEILQAVTRCRVWKRK